MTKHLILFILLFANLFSVSAQTAIDSLLQILPEVRATGDQQQLAELLFNIGDQYDTEEQYEEAIRYLQQSLELFEATGDKLRLAENLNILGQTYSRLFDHENAQNFLQKGLVLFDSLGEQQEIAKVLGNLGNSYEKQGAYQKALDYHSRRLAVEEQLGNQLGMAMAFNNIGLCYSSLGIIDQAFEFFFRSLEIAETLEAQEELANVLGNIGELYSEMADLEKALLYHQRSLAIEEKIGRKWGKAVSLLSIGNVYNQFGDSQQALNYYYEGLALSEEIGDKSNIANLLSNIGSVYCDLGQYEKAMAAVQRALPIVRSIGSRTDESWSLIVLGNIHLGTGQFDLAETAYQQALSLAKETGESEEQVSAIISLAELAKSKGDWRLSQRYAKEGLALAQKTGVALESKMAAEILWESQKALGQHAEALQSYQTYILMRDSVARIENQRASLNFQYEQKALQDSLAFVQQQANIEVAYQQQLAQRNYLAFGGLGLALLIGVLVFSRQQRRSRERELVVQRERAERLEQIDRLKDQFLANTSHELRTPLNGIIGLSEGLLDEEEDLEKQENLSMIVSSGKRLASLVNDILDFSKLRTHEIELRKRPVDFYAMVKFVLRIHQPLVEGKDLQLINAVPTDLPTLLADEDRIQQILFNLVGNASKFTETGYVKVSAQQVVDHLRIGVEDTGIGIPEHKREAIFQAFEQGDGSVQREFAGTGLGLSISKKLVELHGGRMWVESEIGQGSIFFFELPMTEALTSGGVMTFSAPSEAVLPTMAKMQLQSPTPQPDVAESAGERIRILVVDDEPINQQVIKNHLKSHRFELFQAMNGEEALQLLDKHRQFDLVLLDVMMPRMSGYEVCQHIRERFLPSELPVIMLTAKNQVSDLVQGLDMGANDYMAKPFAKDEFLARIKTHLSLHRINKVTNRFVPAEFIRTLGKNTLTEISLGDQVQQQVTVLFTDIRGYTTLAEQMTPAENFRFVNAYAGRMGPIIKQHNGFVNQYLGDGIMAIFQQSPDDSLLACIGMQRSLKRYNQERESRGRQPIRVGMGMHSGSLIMGIIGDEQRTDAATISDTVNTAARMESLTKQVGADILLSGAAMQELHDPGQYQLRYLGKVRVKGRNAPVGVYECFDCDPEAVQRLKQEWLPAFDEALRLYSDQAFAKAIVRFEEIVAANPADRIASNLLRVAKQYLAHGVPEGWAGA
jgi:signal transduction histidine kinase/class 3 adenylate cyclase/CheY-like chemotaxis protein